MKILLVVLAVTAMGCRILPSPGDFRPRRIIQPLPNNPHALFMEGKTYLVQDEPRKASKLFRAALRLQPDFDEALLGLAHAYREAESYRSALKVYRRISEKAPRNAPALEGLAAVLIELGKVDEAQALLERIVKEIAPDSISALNALAEVHYGRREYRRALGYWKRSLELDGSQNEVSALHEDLQGYVDKYVVK